MWAQNRKDMKTINLKVHINDELSNTDEVIELIRHLLIEPGEFLEIIEPIKAKALRKKGTDLWYYYDMDYDWYTCDDIRLSIAYSDRRDIPDNAEIIDIKIIIEP